MKKSLIIILSLCALIALGTLLFQNQHSNKVETIPKQTQSLVKTIKQETVSNKIVLKTLSLQKVSLQKQLAQTKVELEKSKTHNQVLAKNVKQLKTDVQELPIVDTSQTLSLCFDLAETIDSLLCSNQIQDSLFTLQTNMYDSLECVQQNQLAILSRNNQNYLLQLDTLLALNTSLQKQIKKDNHKLVLTKVGNRVLASGLLITTSIATYLQLRKKI